MKMMKKLLDNVGRSWAKVPKDVPVITVQKGIGMHYMYTIEDNQLHFHSTSYNHNLPIKQSIVLEELTLEELVTTIRSMGYNASITSEAVEHGLMARKAFALMAKRDVNIFMPAGITTFTSKLWEMMYPIARLLEEADNNTDVAIQQMFATATRGSWLDYWATFFKIKRARGETDAVMSRRIFMTLINMKTNNMAIEELIQFALQADAEVNDFAPAMFEVVAPADYMNYTYLLDELIRSVKGAGIEYFYHYKRVFEESYPAYMKDKTDMPAREQDGLAWVLLDGFVEGQFGWREVADGFDLNVDLLNSDSLLELQYMLKDEVDITGVLEASEPKRDTSEELNDFSIESNLTEAVPRASEGTTVFEVSDLNEVRFGFAEGGLELNSGDLNNDLFGKYRAKDENAVEVSYGANESYARIQEGGSITLLNSNGTVSRQEAF